MSQKFIEVATDVDGSDEKCTKSKVKLADLQLKRCHVDH